MVEVRVVSGGGGEELEVAEESLGPFAGGACGGGKEFGGLSWVRRRGNRGSTKTNNTYVS